MLLMAAPLSEFNLQVAGSRRRESSVIASLCEAEPAMPWRPESEMHPIQACLPLAAFLFSQANS
jgi:hypothetical protein